MMSAALAIKLTGRKCREGIGQAGCPIAQSHQVWLGIIFEGLKFNFLLVHIEQ
jgi:hypothetical protein